MVYMKPSRLLLYLGIIIVSIAYVQQDADAYRLKKTPKKAKSESKGKFVDHYYGKTGKHTLQTRRDKHKSKRVKTKSKSASPVLMKPISKSSNMKPIEVKPPSQKGPVNLKPVNSRPVSKKDNKKAAQDGPGVKIFNCPKEAIQMNCLSCKTKVYRKCPVVGASAITDVHIVSEYPSSAGRCYVGKKQNYGIVDGSYIWVDKGCRAKFIACYNREIQEPKNINCMCDVGSPHHNCPVGLTGSNIVIKVVMLWSFGKGRCKEDKTWGFDDRRVWVEQGCSATFKVFWS